MKGRAPWTEDRAQAWWAHHRPRTEASHSSEPTLSERLLVPTEESPTAPPSAETMPSIAPPSADLPTVSELPPRSR